MSDHVKVTKDTKFFEGTVDGDKLNHEDKVPGTLYILCIPGSPLVSGYHPGPGTVK